MRKIRKFAAFITAASLLAAYRCLVPVLQHTQIGCASAPVVPPLPPAASTETTLLPDSTLTRETQPVLLAPPAADSPLIIRRESDGSLARHNARPWQSSGDGAGGSIIDRHFGIHSGTQFFPLDSGGQIRNCTFWSNDDLLAESRVQPDLPLRIDGSPMVLIYHTHTTESYVLEKSGVYDSDFNFRSTEPDKNMVAVGDAICAELAAAGIGVVHAAEIHDFPVWSGSYAGSAETVRALLDEFPSICIALDIHRDAISDGSTVVAPVCSINGAQAAQIMIISGCDDGTMNMPNYRENFHFACKLQQTAESMFSGFTRPVLFDYRKYNQDLTTGSLLIEVGSQGNTLEEACRAGQGIGQALAACISDLVSLTD